MVWSYAYRPRGIDPATKKRWPTRTLTLGNPANLSPEDARNEALKARGLAAAGSDPHREKKAKLAAEQTKRSTTADRPIGDYEKALPKRPKMRGTGRPSPSYVGIEIARVRRALEVMNLTQSPVAGLSTQKIRKMLDESDEGDNARARYGALSRFFDWCMDAGHLQTNPCASIARARRPKPSPARSHYLEVADLAKLWTAAADLREPVWRDFSRFLMAVPCRRGEVANLDWAHIHRAGKEWRQLGRMTKNNEPHRLFLTPLPMDVLDARRVAWAEFASHGDPTEAERLLGQGAPKSGLVFPLGEARVPEAVADAILNHRQAATRGGVLGVYRRSVRWPEQVEAMELWGRLLAEAIEGKKVDDAVVPVVRAG
jgi:integrase